jgi:hypothetical protein
VAFLLEKIWLVLVGLGGWVRMGCVWVQLVKLINIVTSVIGHPVIIGVHSNLDAAVAGLTAYLNYVVTK